eukprot:1486365-Prymnesium_polylepis.1
MGDPPHGGSRPRPSERGTDPSDPSSRCCGGPSVGVGTAGGLPPACGGEVAGAPKAASEASSESPRGVWLYVHRLASKWTCDCTATDDPTARTLGLFGPFSPTRRTALAIVKSTTFDRLVLALILTNAFITAYSYPGLEDDH